MSFLQKKLVQAVLYVNSQWPIGKATISYNALQWVSSVLANFGALMTCTWSYYGELKMSLEPTLGLFKALNTIEGCATKSNADNIMMMTRVKPSAPESVRSQTVDYDFQFHNDHQNHDHDHHNYDPHNQDHHNHSFNVIQSLHTTCACSYAYLHRQWFIIISQVYIRREKASKSWRSRKVLGGLSKWLL